MSVSFVERLDRFVRWFFNSSPTAVIEPRPKHPQSLAQALERKRPARAKPRMRSGTGATRGSKATQS